MCSYRRRVLPRDAEDFTGAFDGEGFAALAGAFGFGGTEGAAFVAAFVAGAFGFGFGFAPFFTTPPLVYAVGSPPPPPGLTGADQITRQDHGCTSLPLC